MTNNGRFLMLPKQLLHELQQTGQNELIGYFAEYALDLDTGRKYSRAYYRQKWSVGGSKIERLIKMFDEALANMEASQYLENNYVQKQAGQKRGENGVKTGQPNPDNNESEAGQAGQKRGENGVKTGRIGNQDKDNIKERDINISKEKNIPPTLQEISSYVAEKKLNVDAQKFFDYFDVSGWVDSRGNKVRNWKQKILTWNSRAIEKAQSAARNTSATFKEQILERTFWSDKIKEALKGQGIDWIALVKGEVDMPDGIGYDVVKDQYQNTLYLFYAKQGVVVEAIAVA